MNYLVLNGRRSTEVNGLLIQKLAPITKPLIRTQIEEIDGRDGDVVTKLGYSAYNKEVTIGLHGNFNVDDAIQFFDSEGTVVFSNEPDKYYRYQILEAIDFEKLVRFRTATVTFHVQPFKYSALDEKQILVNQLIHMNDMEITSGDVTLSIDDEVISMVGDGRAEFYIPINPITAEAGTYTLKGVANTTDYLARLVGTVATNRDSFGGGAIGGNTDSITDTLTEDKVFNYLWVKKNGDTDVTLDVSLFDGEENQIVVNNRGNVKSKPTITINGTGLIYLYINGTPAFAMVINQHSMTIDSDKMSAYKGDVLLNRYVSGDYENLMLNIGRNVISWIGDVKSIEIENYARWI